MSLADMRIYTDVELAKPSPIDAYIDLVRITRPATREDVLAAVREWEGVEEVWWCETHERVSGKAWVDGDAKVRVCDLCDQYGNLGRVVPALIVPLDTGDTE